jgi:hypothetical protein
VDDYDPVRTPHVGAAKWRVSAAGVTTMGMATNWTSWDEVWSVTNPTALLPFEVSESTYVDDARHWAEVYGALLSINEVMVVAVDAVVGCAGNNAARNAPIDLRMRAYSHRCRERYAYWVRRGQELQSADASLHGSPVLSTAACCPSMSSCSAVGPTGRNAPTTDRRLRINPI